MRTLIVGFAWVSPLILIILWPYEPVAGVLVMALSHALLLYPTLHPNVQWLGPVITRFDADRREVWLTIDDGPAGDTEAILDVLAARGVPATFFVKGVLAQVRPDLISAMRAGGHGIGNHSHTHPSATFWCLPPADIAAEVDRCNAVLGGVTHFRAPVGMKNPGVHPALARRGMRLIGWSARAFDSVSHDPRRVAARIVSRTEPGTILVLHQGRPQSLACITRVIDELQRAGYAFVIPSDERLNTNR